MPLRMRRHLERWNQARLAPNQFRILSELLSSALFRTPLLVEVSNSTSPFATVFTVGVGVCPTLESFLYVLEIEVMSVQQWGFGGTAIRSRFVRKRFLAKAILSVLCCVASCTVASAGQSIDIDGDGCGDFVVVRSEGGQLVWYISPSSNNNSFMPSHYPREVLGGRNAVRIPFGLHGDQFLLFDVTGDNRPEILTYRPSVGHWYIRWSSWDGQLELPFSALGLPHALYSDGDNIGDLAFIDYLRSTMTVRLSTGQILQNVPIHGSYRTGRPPQTLRLVAWRRYSPTKQGENGIITSAYFLNGFWRSFSNTHEKVADRWEPDDSSGFSIVGDYNGDGRIDAGSFIQGRWRIFSNGGKIIDTWWGLDGDIPVLGDFDGDGKYDLCVWRRTTATFYIVPSAGIGLPGWTPHHGGFEVQWGLPTDIAVMGAAGN
jgi:hypothetical protein